MRAMFAKIASWTRTCRLKLLNMYERSTALAKINEIYLLSSVFLISFRQSITRCRLFLSNTRAEFSSILSNLFSYLGCKFFFFFFKLNINVYNQLTKFAHARDFPQIEEEKPKRIFPRFPRANELRVCVKYIVIVVLKRVAVRSVDHFLKSLEFLTRFHRLVHGAMRFSLL